MEINSNEDTFTLHQPRGTEDFARNALTVCLPNQGSLAEREDALAALATKYFRKGINNRLSLKLRETEAGLVGVIPTRRHGVFIIRPSAAPGQRVTQCDKMEQGFSGSEVFKDGTVALLNTLNGKLYVGQPGRHKLSEHPVDEDFVGLDDSTEIFIAGVPGGQIQVSGGGIQRLVQIPEFAGKQAFEPLISVPEIG